MILQPLRLGFPDEGHEVEAAHEAGHDAAAVGDGLAVHEGDRRRHRRALLLLLLQLILLVLLVLMLLHDGVMLVHAECAATAAEGVNVFYREENQADVETTHNLIARRHRLLLQTGRRELGH